MKEAEKLALLVPKSPEKFADKNSSYIKVFDDNGKSFDMNLNSFKEAKRTGMASLAKKRDNQIDMEVSKKLFVKMREVAVSTQIDQIRRPSKRPQMEVLMNLPE